MSPVEQLLRDHVEQISGFRLGAIHEYDPGDQLDLSTLSRCTDRQRYKSSHDSSASHDSIFVRGKGSFQFPPIGQVFNKIVTDDENRLRVKSRDLETKK